MVDDPLAHQQPHRISGHSGGWNAAAWAPLSATIPASLEYGLPARQGDSGAECRVGLDSSRMAGGADLGHHGRQWRYFRFVSGSARDNRLADIRRFSPNPWATT